MAKANQSRPPRASQARLEAVARLFSVLAEPTRLRILQLLQDGPATVGRIVERLGARQANISKQLAVLRQAGLVDRSREGPSVRYWISEPMIFNLCDMVCNKLQRDAEAALKAFAAPASPES